MADTILDTMDSWKRIAGSADADGSFTPFTQDKAVVEALSRILIALNGIRARLDAGINTKTVTTLANVTL
jgi:hypothetical protein